MERKEEKKNPLTGVVGYTEFFFDRLFSGRGLFFFLHGWRNM